jgi:hypothetical protein
MVPPGPGLSVVPTRKKASGPAPSYSKSLRKSADSLMACSSP